MSLENLRADLVPVAEIAMTHEFYEQFVADCSVDGIRTIPIETVSNARAIFIPVWSDAYKSVYPDAIKRDILYGFIEFTRAFKLRG